MSVAIVTQCVTALFILPLEFEVKTFIIYRSWRLFIQMGNLCAISASVILMFLPESPKFLLSIARDQEALSVLKKIYSTNGTSVEV